MGALAASFLWTVAVDFYVESGARSFATRVVLWIAGIAAIAVLFYFFWEIWLSPHLLLGSLLILVGLAGYLGRRESNSTFWLFNHRLWLGAGLALVGAGLFAAGLVAIFATLNILFGLELPPHWQEHVITVSLCFVAPVSFLAFAPRSFTDPITAREEDDFTMRAAAALVKFVLVPLLLVYTAILYAYAIKIVLAWELPKGTLGGMVVGYLLVGAATLLVGYPSRESGGPHVRLFWRYWVELAALPVVLLFIAVGRRIADYGVTEQRYLMVLIGVWALILAGIRIIRGRDFDLRLVPGVLAFLIFAASFGPGGVIGFSVMSQKEQLAELLTDEGHAGRRQDRAARGRRGRRTRSAAMRGGRGASNGISTLTARSICSRPGSRARPTTPSPRARSPRRRRAICFWHSGSVPTSRIRPALSISRIIPTCRRSLRSPRSGHVIGPVVFESSGPAPATIPPQTVAVEGLGTVHLELADTLLTVRLESGEEVKFDIQDAVKEIYRRGWPLTQDHHPVEIKGAGTGLVGTLIVDNLNGAYKEPTFDISLLRCWLVLAREG